MEIELVIGLFFLLTLIGVPIAFSIAAASAVYMIVSGTPWMVAGQRMVSGADSFPLLAAPLFMLAGTIMNAGGIMGRLLHLSDTVIGHVRGGLAQVNVLSSLLMAGMSGSATADAAGQGATMIPAMKKSGYPAPLSAVVTSASSVIGPIFPPSVPFVIYGSVAQVSIGQLFIGGVLPGIVMTLILILTVYLTSRRGNYRTREKFVASDFFRALRIAALDLLLPLIIVGGIVGGIFTPVEAAAIAVFYALLLELVIFRQLKLQQLPAILLSAAKMTAMIMFVIAVSNVFGWILIRENFSSMLASGLMSISSDPLILRCLVVLLLVLLGLVIETVVLIILIVPILLSLAPALMMDPIHLGVTVVFSTMLGLITPPVGLCMFLVNSISGISVGTYTKAILPYFAALLFCAFAIALVPGLTMWLPNLLMR
ncbi:TRAP transporter, DctM subunit [Roseovarius pacificus]|uniref:TRAP transporter large permease protein n=1 Tax=Roseovarius pacificus TaxID=337701 RepID=A0A1M7AC08_9RHOB|nr:TRAP transporter large permease [Roseovarius pacificus]GGO53638.1 ABC transporter permease [Roseovarius pacificus]SHL40186.1 TRAP transporter, DctM subunit [Roseovarius pacificus]